MKKIKVHVSKDYDIIIGKDILATAGDFCREALGGVCRLCLVTDDIVAPFYLDTVHESLEQAGFDVFYYVLPHGEDSKSTENFVELLEILGESRLTRTDALIALGGGVVGDLTGFVAATYLRGIPFIQIPTTLLAAVDSSVGGKTAINLQAGKNLAGAFHQPSLVLFDVNTLQTLSPETFADGCAEVIKYGVINDRSLFDRLSLGFQDQMEEIIAACVANKAAIVEQDEFDRGTRQLLNFGHTVGHAVELCSGFSISHGSAVSMGMVLITRAAARLGYCPAETADELISLLSTQGLPTECAFSVEALTEIALADKKRAGDFITLVVPRKIGVCELIKIPAEELSLWIAKGLEA